MASTKIQEVKRKLISANHILHKNGAVDGYGFIAARHPEREDIFIMAGYGAPALIEASEDLFEFWVKDCTPVDPNAKKAYKEIYIVGELFRRYPQIQAAVHSHANEVLPYCCSSVPVQAFFHMAGFLGDDVPVWDIRRVYDDAESHQQDMLVNNQKLGSSLAAAFSKDPDGSGSLDYNVVLQSHHGYTTHGPDIEHAVYRACYTKTNASVQTETILLQSNYAKLAGKSDASLPNGLSGRVAAGCGKMNDVALDKAWALWMKQVKVDSLYTNRLDN